MRRIKLQTWRWLNVDARAVSCAAASGKCWNHIPKRVEDFDAGRAVVLISAVIERKRLPNLQGPDEVPGGVVEERQEKILTALERFEAWAARVRGFLDDPTYTISQQDKISALLILGVKATVWPASGGFEERLRLKLAPPDIARFCDFDFGR